MCICRGSYDESLYEFKPLLDKLRCIPRTPRLKIPPAFLHISFLYNKLQFNQGILRYWAWASPDCPYMYPVSMRFSIGRYTSLSVKISFVEGILRGSL